MIKSIKTILSQDKEKFVVPKKVQDLIPIKCIWPDGIFKVGNKFSKTYKFSDINYMVASREDKESMFLTYSELLNSLDSGATTKITINNHRLNKADFEDSILMPMKRDGLDGYRMEYNNMLLDKATGANGITQEKYVTISVSKKDIEEARAYFARVGADLTTHFTADTKEQLDLDTETILSTARKHMCQMATLKFQQTDGLNTVLPIGVRKINTFRTLTTESLAVLMPFKVQEIMDQGGIYFGENAISHNLIMCNKANLLNQSVFLLGVPGSGKSFSAKELITFLMLNTDDDILICDPEGEYAPLVEAMGNLGSVIRVSAGGRDRLNAMYMVDGYGENNPIVVKSEFIMSLIEQIDKKGVGPQHKSIIDRCITNVYRNAAEDGTVPTLCTLRDMLLEQPEPEAKQIALSLELYTTGSLDIFGNHSTYMICLCTPKNQ